MQFSKRFSPANCSFSSTIKSLAMAVSCILPSGLALAAVGTPEWVGETNISTDDGYADLSWGLPDGEFAEVWELTESVTGQDPVIIFVDKPQLRLFRITPGLYDFRVRGCLKNLQGFPECGPQSTKLRLTVTENAIPAPNRFTPPESPPEVSAFNGGPQELSPGGWVAPNKPAQGWYFYWANRLHDGDPASAYDLVGIWYTFEAKSVFFDNEVCQCNRYGDYLPVTAELRLVQLDSDTFNGGIWIRRNGTDANIGGAAVHFNASDPTNATLAWNANFKLRTIPVTSHQIDQLVGSDPASIVNNSHYSGQYRHATNNTYFVDDLIADTVEVINITFEDSAGDPVWIQATNASLTETSVNFCAQYLNAGYPPDGNTPTNDIYNFWYEDGCDTGIPVSSTNRNGRRFFSGFETERLWATFTLPGGAFNTGSVSIGTNSVPATLNKDANFHGITYDYAPGGASCSLTESTPSCTVTLTWYTDGNYPNATAYAHRSSPSTARTKILTSTEPAMVNQTYVITTAGTYDFELRMGNSSSSELIAESATFTVIDDFLPTIPVAPTGLNGIWINQNTYQYEINWAHSNTQNVGYYNLEETPPGGSATVIQVQPGGQTSHSYTKSSGPFGSYAYRVRACNTEGCSAWTSTLNWQVNKIPDPLDCGTGGYVFCDDFETDQGWVADFSGTDTATTGTWERADPSQTSNSGVIYQLGTTVSGSFDLVTEGSAGAGAGTYDVDNGVTTITSPLIALPSGGTVSLSYHYYFSHSNTGNSGDYLRAYLETSGGDVLLLEELGSADFDQAEWAPTGSDLSAYAGQSVRIRFEAADGTSIGALVEAAVDDLSIVFTPAPQPPTIGNPGNQLNDQGDTVNLSIPVSDPEGAQMSCSATGLPSALAVAIDAGNENCVVAGTVTAPEGVYSVTITVSDGSLTDSTPPFNWTVDANQPPSIANPGTQNSNPDDVINLAIPVSDADGDQMSCSGAGLPPSLGVAIDGANTNCVVSGTITVASDATYSVTITVNDGNGGTANSSFTWQVTTINQDPSIGNPGTQNSNPDDVINLAIPVSDADGDQMSCSGAGLPPSLGVAIDGTNTNCVVSGTITVASDATYSVTITVNDGNGGTANSSFTWQVTTINQDPSIGNPGTQNSNPDDVISLAIPVSDPDGDQMNCSASGLPPSLGVAIDGANANCVVSGTITATSDATYPVTITVSDGNGGTANSIFSWVVTTINQDPTISNPGTQNSNPDDVISLAIPVSDPDGDQMSCSASGLPASLGVAIDGANANCVVSGTITAADGTYPVIITVNDDDDGTAATNLDWVVETPNSDPTIENPGTQNSQPNDVVSLSIPVSDPDGDQMSCSASGLPASLGVTIDGANEDCVVSGTITAADGNYPVTITVSDGNGGTAGSIFTWIVFTPGPSSPETPPMPAGAPGMTPTIGSSEVGATAGQFRVDESGSATYSMPILTAPGSGGVAPEISLNYSSQSGNGPLGMGWSLGGISAITRCSKTTEQDGPTALRGITLTANDRFCLDGQRLLLVSGAYGANGAEYRTEIDAISRIKSVGSFGTGPASFTVERKDGSISEYGNTPDSQIEAGSEVLTWAQNQFKDSAGNYINYEYDEATGGAVEFVLDRIAYTGNGSQAPYAQIVFTYDTEQRNDLSYAYVAGVELVQNKLLKRIDSQAKKDAASAYSSLRSYFLSYDLDGDGVDDPDGMGRMALQSVEECNDSLKSACFTPTGFTWLNSLHGIDTAIPPGNVLAKNQVLYGLQIADVSGDGRPDILYTKKTGQSYKLEIQSPNASGTFSGWGGSYILPQKEDGTPPRVFGIDLNADGFQDVVYRKHLGNGNYAWVGRISNGTSLGGETADLAPSFVVNEAASSIESNIAVLDFNGDGLSDVLFNKTSTLGDTHDLQVILNTYQPGGPVGFGDPIVVTSDFSSNSNSLLFPPISDGGTFRLYNNQPAFYETGSQYAELQKEPANQVFDYNGDGAVDFLIYVWRVYEDCTAGCPIQQSIQEPVSPATTFAETDRIAAFWVMLTSTPLNTYDYEVIATGRDCGLSFCVDQHPGLPTAHEVRPVDINADGLVDLAFSTNANDWYYKLNTGNGLGVQQSFGIGALPQGQQDAVRFEDLNGDGYADLIYPSVYNDNGSNATWKVAYNRFGQSFATPVTTGIKAGNVGGESNNENDASIFADFTGDGKADHFYVNFDTQSKPGNSTLYPGWNQLNSSSTQAPSNAITAITNGLGAVTSISYKPLTDTSVYSRMRDSGNADWGAGSVVYDLVAPVYVVSQASSSAPTFSSTSAISSVQYHYVGAKIQAGGRGFLGFGEVISYDPQNGIRTNTRYRQDFPFTGLPADTTQSLAGSGQEFDTVSNTSAIAPVSWGSVTATTAAANPSGIRISYAVNQWNSAATAGGALFPFIANSLERSYTLTGAFDRKILTSNVYGAFGNLSSATVKTYATDGTTVFATQTTSNTYEENDNDGDDANWQNAWLLGRLATSTVTHSRAGQPNIIRRSSFAYDPVTGILDQEVIEPNNNTFKVTTDYQLDAFGNRTQSTVTGFGMTPRDSSSTFDALGRFVVETRNEFGQVTQKVNDWDAYGNALQTENIDGVLTLAAVDFMGRPFVSYTETGGFSKTTHSSTSTAFCPSGTAIKSTTTGGGVPDQFQCQDVLGRTIRTATEGFDGTLIFVDQYFDSSGRPERVSEPYYAGLAPFWNLSSYDEVGRPLMQRLANNTGQTILDADGNREEQLFSYDSSATNPCGVTPAARVSVTTNGKGQERLERKNALGETTDVYDDDCGRVSYEYDATGNLTQVTGADNETVTMTYDLAGRKTAMSDPDKGNWQYAYNPLGEMTRQLDAKAQAIDFTYDTLGRVTNRRELSGVSSLTDATFTTHNHEITSYQNSTELSVMGKGQPSSMVYRQGEAGTILQRRDYVYDSFGRVDAVSEQVDGVIGQFAEQTTYDQFGRVFQQFDASGDDRGLRYVYNSSGYLSQLKEARDGTAGTIYQQIETMDARGNVTYMLLGNGVDVFANYEASSGRLNELSAYKGMVELQYVDYLFDVLGNLRQRHDLSAAADLHELFDYDSLNRLLTVDLTVNGGTSGQTLALSYDASGNILTKSDVENGAAYNYGANGAGPHAVTSVGSLTYLYDANGNQTSGDGRTITYTVFDKAEVITKGAKQAVFSYGIGNSRYKREDIEGGITQKTTLYLGSVERIDEGGSISFKRYLGGVAVATYYPSTQAQNLAYLLKDHIGSIHTVLNESAQIMASMHFSAFGERQDTDDWQTPLTAGLYAPLNDITTRGFTGHEQVDDVGIIHMNGRIYDAKLGRFLQADPIVQAPKNSQNLNRYSYVLNNPLSYTDPSGFFLKRLFNKLRPLISIALIAVAPWGTAFWATVGTGALAGWIASGNLKGALVGAFSGAVLHGIGEHFSKVARANSGSASTIGSSGLTASQFGGKIAAHSIAGGVMTELQGGKFGHGFFAAGATQAFSSKIDSIDSGNYGISAQRVMAAATVGGTVSALTGGKFANGAVTGAFSRGFNDEIHEARRQRVLEAARALGEARVGPYLSGYDSNDPNFHRYTVGPTALCTIDEMGCSFAMASPITGSASVPFTFWYSGPGGYSLPYGLGLDPITHLMPNAGIWLNVTREGHRYHPGSVAHALYPSGGKLWLYSVGAGVGAHAGQNVRIGELLFGAMHLNVRAGVLQQQLEIAPSIGPWQ